MKTSDKLNNLIKAIADMEQVDAIGISGTMEPLPAAGEGDIDIFIYCSAVPAPVQRREMLFSLSPMLGESTVGVYSGGHWGAGDCTSINGVETWLMYFTMDEALGEVEDVLSGKLLDRQDRYYFPIGRIAMLGKINILYDRNGFLSTLKSRLSVYPEGLARKMTARHLEGLMAEEDLLRAVNRKDPLFYHFALEPALDHFLMALFALNREYFPSRKRSLEYIDRFKVKPEGCGNRLLEIVRLGGEEKSLKESYEKLKELASELANLCEEMNENK